MNPKRLKNKKESKKIEVIFQNPSKINLSSLISPKNSPELDKSFKNLYKSFRNENKMKFYSQDFISNNNNKNNNYNINSKSNKYINPSLNSACVAGIASDSESIRGFRKIAKKFSEKINIDNNNKNKEDNYFPFISKFNFEKKVDSNIKIFDLKPFNLSYERINEEKKLLEIKNFNYKLGNINDININNKNNDNKLM
jgi:hypothetical protein